MTTYTCLPVEKSDISLKTTHGLAGKRMVDAVLFNHVASPRRHMWDLERFDVAVAFTYFIA